ncbi:MAG: Txe/YoeB family addiction module toxin [Bacteroidales bacterium]|nr:Txe/YoeB family addiction module toxin [Bacteroidales bacterium]
MKYIIHLTENALDGIDYFKAKRDRTALAKIKCLLNELSEHPYTGTGKPELLKGDYEGYWSRRINQKDRMIYCVDNAVITVTVIQIGKHYNDK